MHIVTSGSAYIDIDAFAGCVAYAELLQAQGVEAKAVSNAPWNESISKTVHSWQAPMITNYVPSDQDTFTLIDISNPAYFEKFVDTSRIDMVIDHHAGFEEFWHQKIGDNARIEFIGAACTLVYELWQQSGLFDKMSVISARLLVCGILDNTLNFGAKVTSPRDIDAYKELVAKAELSDDWAAEYFTECQESIIQNATTAIQNDTKITSFKSFEAPITFSQLAVWDGKQVLADKQEVLSKVLADIKPEWLINLISVGECKSYFVADNLKVQAWLTDLLGIHFTGSVAVADRLWLRKEIIKCDLETV